MQTLWQDLSCDARMPLKKPGFTLIVVITLALGVGAGGGRAQVAAPKDVAKGNVGDKLVYRATLELTDYNLLFTRVKINGREARALIDSGSFRAIQLSSTLAQSLRLELTRTGKASRRYEGKEIYPTSGRIDSLAVGDYEQRDAAIVVIEGDIENIAAQVGTKFDTGAPMCNLDLDLANAPKGAKVSRELTLAERRFPLEFRAKDLAAIRKSLGCVGVIGNNFLSQYAVYFDPGAKVIHLSSGGQ